MDLEKILSQYDAMFGKNSLKEIEAYLVSVIEEAEKKGEKGILVTLLNEIIGFCRDTTQKEKALHYCDWLQAILKEMHLEGRIDYATSLLNVANAYRAFGLFKESLALYQIVENTYNGQIEPTDFMYASLYNNWSLLYQEMEDYESARDLLKKALAIADAYPDAVIPQAVSRTNLAATLLQIKTKQAYEEAVIYLEEALAVFEKDGGVDFHYGAALVAMGDACSYQKEYDRAAHFYEKGLDEIEKHVGKTDNYERVKEKWQYAKSQSQMQPDDSSWISNLERSRIFYETYGKKMIHEKFPAYEEQIAVGLVGEGSDCFGFDDPISADHDYAAGFCMWLTQTDYEQIGSALQEEYEKLIAECADGASVDYFLKKRRGVFTVNDFYNQLLGTAYDYEKAAECDLSEKMNKEAACSFCGENGKKGTESQYPGGAAGFWETVSFSQLAAAVNGMVFTDKAGIFSEVRKQLESYYPDSVFRRLLAQGLHDFSQYAQSNYARMMARKDYVTAQLCVAKAIESTMDLVYLLTHTYAPYYKWKKKGLEKLALAKEKNRLAGQILPLLEEIVLLPLQSFAWQETVYSPVNLNTQDSCVVIFEKIAAHITEEMNRQGLIKGTDVFLESYIAQIIGENNRMDMVEKIVELEWKQFDKVQNEGGRAGCQDDYPTFSIMRKSQYMTWPEELLNSFYTDLCAAQQKGWNLITEKYARMMKSTAPEKYAELEKELPALDEDRIAIQEEIIKIQVGWMEEFAAEYPNMAGNARRIHTSEDTAFDTSYETYLRGELGTYSEETFLLYGRFITGLLKENRNLAYEIMTNTAKLYGYQDVDAAEKALG